MTQAIEREKTRRKPYIPHDTCKGGTVQSSKIAEAPKSVNSSVSIHLFFEFVQMVHLEGYFRSVQKYISCPSIGAIITLLCEIFVSFIYQCCACLPILFTKLTNSKVSQYFTISLIYQDRLALRIPRLTGRGQSNSGSS